MEIGINLYTLRDLEEAPSKTLERVSAAGYDGVEFAGVESDVVEAIEETGLSVAGAHVPIEELEDGFEAAVETYRDLGCERLVVPYLPEEGFESIAAVEETANRLDGLADRLAERGFELHYHNHDHEFTDLGEETGFEAFCERSSVGLEFDLGWLVAAGHDPTAFLDRYGHRVALSHAKDTREGTPVELGDGELDLDGSIEAARAAGVEWFVYEHDTPDDPIESLEHGAKTLRSAM
ncbi:MAG: sugar phosphate isomerase/epimerase [Halalkalicoccus sp.]